MTKTFLWIASGAGGDEERNKLRAEIEKAYADPAYSIITNYPLYWCRVEQGDIVTAENARVEQLTQLREELKKAWADPKYIPIVPVNVSVSRKPAGSET